METEIEVEVNKDITAISSTSVDVALCSSVFMTLQYMQLINGPEMSAKAMLS